MSQEHAQLSQVSELGITLKSYAAGLDERCKYEEALIVKKELYAIKSQLYGTEHPDTLTALCNYAVTLYKLEREAEAEACMKTVLELTGRILGPTDDPMQLVPNDELRSLASDGKCRMPRSASASTLADPLTYSGSTSEDEGPSCSQSDSGGEDATKAEETPGIADFGHYSASLVSFWLEFAAAGIHEVARNTSEAFANPEEYPGEPTETVIIKPKYSAGHRHMASSSGVAGIFQHFMDNSVGA